MVAVVIDDVSIHIDIEGTAIGEVLFQELAAALDTSDNLNVRAAAALLRKQHNQIEELCDALQMTATCIALHCGLHPSDAGAWAGLREQITPLLSRIKEQQ